MTRSELTRRLQAFHRGQQFAGALGVLPLLGVYLLVHTSWLAPYVKAHQHLMALTLTLGPLTWLLATTQGWKRLAPRWLGLGCRHCGASLATLSPANVDPATRCPQCDGTVFDVDGDTD
jgi:hypothetical protein